MPLATLNWNPALDTWIVVAGVLCAVACALPGTFLMLRRMSMMGDAISHAVLPGLAIAFLFAESRNSVAMFLGAAAVGALTALLTQWVHRLGKVEESASMGVVFTALFALGLLLIVRAADHVDLDPGCVLYGAIELVPLDLVTLAGTEIPRAVLTLSAILFLNLLFVGLLYKELKISSFDPALATTLGIHAGLMHYLLMIVVAVTTVAAFESVGSILVIAMLIVPAATAHLLTDRLSLTLLLAAGIAAASAVLGHLGAIALPPLIGFDDTSTSGMMAVMVGALFLLALLAAPRHGLLSRLLVRLALTLRITEEDVLGVLYRLEENGRAGDAPRIVRLMREARGASLLLSRAALADLRRRGEIDRRRAVVALTERGRTRARGLVRSHRLWEAYLEKHWNVAPERVHIAAERLEHVRDESIQRRLAERTDHAQLDPHGSAIPEQNPPARREKR